MKRGIKMALLLGVLVLLLGGYALIGRMNTQTQVGETAGDFPLWDNAKAVASLAWSNDGEDYAFTRGESVWMREGDAAFPVNQTVVQNLADTISGLTAARQLTAGADPADYGLAEPAFRVTAGDAQGEATTFSLGDATPFADGYYLSVSGDDAIYVVEDSLADVFDKTLTQLAAMESLPDVTDVQRVTVGSALDISLDGQTWRDTASSEALDAQAVETLVSDASGISWSALVDTAADDEALAERGLDGEKATRVTLYDGDGEALALLLGGEDGQGNRYARLPDSRMVYTVYGDDADALLSAGLDTLWNRRPETLAADELGEAFFSWAGGERTFTAQDSESSSAQAILEQLGAIAGTARVAADESGGEILAVRLTDADGGETALTFFGYDADSYLLPTTEESAMLVPAEDVDRLIRLLRLDG